MQDDSNFLIQTKENFHARKTTLVSQIRKVVDITMWHEIHDTNGGFTTTSICERKIVIQSFRVETEHNYDEQNPLKKKAFEHDQMQKLNVILINIRKDEPNVRKFPVKLASDETPKLSLTSRTR